MGGWSSRTGVSRQGAREGERQRAFFLLGLGGGLLVRLCFSGRHHSADPSEPEAGSSQSQPGSRASPTERKQRHQQSPEEEMEENTSTIKWCLGLLFPYLGRSVPSAPIQTSSVHYNIAAFSPPATFLPAPEGGKAGTLAIVLQYYIIAIGEEVWQRQPRASAQHTHTHPID